MRDEIHDSRRALLWSQMRSIRESVDVGGWDEDLRKRWDRADAEMTQLTTQIQRADGPHPVESETPMSLLKLRDQKSAAWSRAIEFKELVDSGKTLTPEQDAEWERALDTVEQVDATIQRLERGEAFAAGDDDAARSSRDGIPAGVTRPGTQRSDGFVEMLHRGDSLTAWSKRRQRSEWSPDSADLSLTRMVRGMATGLFDGAEAEQRAMGSSVGATGGHLVPAPLAAAILDLARNQSRCMEAGAVTVPMTSATLKVPMLAEDITATWRDEHELIPETTPGFRAVELQSHTLAAIVKISRELLEDAPQAGDAVAVSAARTIATGFDLAGLYGAGMASQPTGLKIWGSGQPWAVPTTALGTGDGAVPTNYDHLVDAIGAVHQRNHTPTGVILAPRTEVTYSKFKDTTNQPLQAPKMVTDVPRLMTNQVKTNLSIGDSDDTSDLFVGDWRHLAFGVRTNTMFISLKERYADTGEIGLLIWFRGDVAVMRPDAFQIVTGVRS